MATQIANGYVTVYEASDGGSGDPAKTTWQFFVGTQAVNTTNHFLAQTARLAVNTNSRVQVTFDDTNRKVSQLRVLSAILRRFGDYRYEGIGRCLEVEPYWSILWCESEFCRN
jgi:hypothetical protein